MDKHYRKTSETIVNTLFFAWTLDQRSKIVWNYKIILSIRSFFKINWDKSLQIANFFYLFVRKCQKFQTICCFCCSNVWCMYEFHPLFFCLFDCLMSLVFFVLYKIQKCFLFGYPYSAVIRMLMQCTVPPIKVSNCLSRIIYDPDNVFIS